jgi:hypothetical protein
VLPDRAVGKKLIPLGDDLADGRKIKRIENLELGEDFPGEKKADYPDDPEPIRERRPGAPDELARGRWLGAFERNKIEGRMLFAFGRSDSCRVPGAATITPSVSSW